MAPRTTLPVVVTGASSGIGRAITQHLDAMGWNVIPTVRSQADGEALQSLCSGRLRPLMLDFTVAESIELLAAELNALLPDFALGGLVNNAGIAVAGPLETTPLDVLRRQFEVNVFGHVAVIQKLLPALRKGQGRIVNIGSISGRLSCPFVGPYAASKAALAALNDSLRLELRRFGVWVSIVDPGNTATPIWSKSLERAISLEKSKPLETQALYRVELEQIKLMTEQMSRNSSSPAGVCRAVAGALSARWPRARYTVGAEAKLIALAARLLPPRCLDMLILSQLKLWRRHRP